MRLLPILILTLMLSSCCKKAVESNPFTPYVGKWGLYEILRSDIGETVKGDDVTGRNIFGAYKESVQILQDGVFIPFLWGGVSNANVPDVSLANIEKGRVSLKDGNLTFSEGIFSNYPMAVKVLKISSTELWLGDSDNISSCKLKRIN